MDESPYLTLVSPFLSPIPASALGLHDAEDDSQPPRPYAPLIQSFTRFALEHMATESWASHMPMPALVPPSPANVNAPAPSVVSQVLGMEFKQTTACLLCGARNERPTMIHTLDLTYPRQVRALFPSQPLPPPPPSRRASLKNFLD